MRKDSQFVSHHDGDQQISQAKQVCRVGMHSSIHQYKLLVSFSTNPTSGGSLWRLTCIEHIWSLPSLFWPQFHSGSKFLTPAKNHRFLRFIRECGSTLYVGLARAVPPTNTNFRLTFLLNRLQEALYEDLPEVYHHFSGLSFIAEVNFWSPPKTIVSCDIFIIIINIINFFRRVFSKYTEAVTTFLIPIDAILPEICTFIVGLAVLCGLKWGPCGLIS